MSVQLNLLPWRERRRLAAIRRMQSGLVGAVLCGVIGVCLLDRSQDQRLHRQLSSNDELRVALDVLQQAVDRGVEASHALAAVQVRQASMNGLREGQRRLPELFIALERALPVGLRLVDLKLDGERMQLGGLAASASVIAQFMRELQGASSVQGLELQWVGSEADGDRFQLSGQLRVGQP